MKTRIKKTTGIIILGLLSILSSCNSSKRETSEVNSPTEAKTNIPPKKYKLFNNVPLVREKLESVGIGLFTRWKKLDDLGWMSSTPYYSFGSTSSTIGLPNNLAFYLESNSEDCIGTIQLVLNINNTSERKKALSKFNEIMVSTFKGLDLKDADKFSKAIKQKRNYSFENNEYKISLEIEKININNWELIIEAK
jgi:hypothetical protein